MMRARMIGRIAAGVVILTTAFTPQRPACAATVVSETLDGLSAEADFTVVGSTLTIVLTNTSTGAPVGFDESDQLLTSVSFLLPVTHTILGGTAAITAGSNSVNFDDVVAQLSGGEDVSVEWGFGNGGTTNLFDNFVSTLQASTTPFVAVSGLNPNLDGADELNGPQGGLTNGVIPLAGLGGIQNSVTFSLSLSDPLPDLSFLNNGVRWEFGSDAAFVDVVPEPSSLGLLCIGLLIVGVKAARLRRI